MRREDLAPRDFVLEIEADHAPALELGGKARRSVNLRELGGKARRSVNLRVLPPEPAMPATWTARPGVPPRSSCRGSSLHSPCEYVRCPSHLWMVDAVDRPGRRHANGAGPSSELDPRTLHTCEADIVEYARAHRPERGRRGELLTFEEIGATMGLSAERARQILQSARLKIEARGETLDDYLEASWTERIAAGAA